MSTTTTNFSLVKPALTDSADITAMNPNWDKIDKLLGDAWYKTATIIDTNSDLNNISKIGLYIYSSASASTIKNIPEVSQGTMLVLPRLVNNDQSNITQVIITRENSIYVRAKYDNTWQEWSKVASTVDVSSITASSLSAVSWTQVVSATFESFWSSIYDATDGVTGAVTFRVKDTGGWCPTGVKDMWHNGIAFWQNAPSSTDNVNGIILLRVNAPNNGVLYKGSVTGNATNGYTVSWASIYDTGNKPTASDVGALPSTGGIVNGQVRLRDMTNSNSCGRLYSSDGLGLSSDEDIANSDSARNVLKINRYNTDLKNAIRFAHVDERGTSDWYNMYGEHNKPTGSYSGNGNITHRPINTGGIGSLCLISGYGHTILLGKFGGFCVKANATTGSNVTTINYLDAYFENGVIHLETANDALNRSGETYTWQVI